MAEVVSTALAWLISSVSLMVGRAEVTFWTLGGRMITGTTPTKRQAWKATMSSKPGGGATGGAVVNTYIHLPYTKCVCVCVCVCVCACVCAHACVLEHSCCLCSSGCGPPSTYWECTAVPHGPRGSASACPPSHTPHALHACVARPLTASGQCGPGGGEGGGSSDH